MRSLLGCAVLLVVLPACSEGSADTQTSNTSTTTVSTSSSTTSAPAPSSTSTTTTTVASESTAPVDTLVSTGTIAVPKGALSVDDNDMFVVHDGGDLWLHPGLRGGPPGAPVRLVDMGDPRVPVTEGEPPNTVEDVVGEVGGAVYFSDCCEPIAGDVRAATAPDVVQLVGYGTSLALSPDRTRLATLNTFGLQVADLTARTSTFRAFDTPAAPIHPWDLIWSADGRRLIMIFFDEHGGSLMPFSASGSLQPGNAVPVDVTFDPAQPPGVQFTGHGPNGEIAIAFLGTDGTKISFFDPDTLTAIPSMARELPAGVSSIRLDADGVGLLWIDHNTLWYLPATGTVRQLGKGYTGAWFAH